MAKLQEDEDLERIFRKSRTPQRDAESTCKSEAVKQENNKEKPKGQVKDMSKSAKRWAEICCNVAETVGYVSAEFLTSADDRKNQQKESEAWIEYKHAETEKLHAEVRKINALGLQEEIKADLMSAYSHQCQDYWNKNQDVMPTLPMDLLPPPMEEDDLK